MSWFAVRNIFRHGAEADGSAIYEERTLLFRADSPDRAFEMSEAEVARYLEVNPTFSRAGQPTAFKLRENDSDLHGAVVWDVPGLSHLGPDDFVQKYYTDVECQPEDLEPDEDDSEQAP